MLNLSDRLRAGGIDCNIDQYEISPSIGWSRWMNDQIEMAGFVLVVCTKTYESRFKGRGKPAEGLGAKWEGAIITQAIYETNSMNTKFIPVVFSSEDSAYIPGILRSATRYNPTAEEDYESLYRHLTNQPYILKLRTGEIQPMLPRERKPELGNPTPSKQSKKTISNIPDMDTKVIINKSDINVLKDPPGILVMLCGPSAVGKDAVASRMRGRLDQLGIEAHFPQKYTTRPIRKQEDTPIDGRWFEPSSQYKFLTDEELNTRPNIIGKYNKFGFSYGFDKEGFENKSLMKKFLICIYGDLFSLADFKKKIEEKYARKVFVVFLQAPEKDLLTRLDTRPGMPGGVIKNRKKEMIRDIARLERMYFGGDCIKINNSNMDNPDKVSEKLLQIVLGEIGYLT